MATSRPRSTGFCMLASSTSARPTSHHLRIQLPVWHSIVYTLGNHPVRQAPMSATQALAQHTGLRPTTRAARRLQPGARRRPDVNCESHASRGPRMLSSPLYQAIGNNTWSSSSVVAIRNSHASGAEVSSYHPDRWRRAETLSQLAPAAHAARPSAGIDDNIPSICANRQGRRGGSGDLAGVWCMRGFYAREYRAEKFGRLARWTLNGESTGRRQELDLEQAGQETK